MQTDARKGNYKITRLVPTLPVHDFPKFLLYTLADGIFERQSGWKMHNSHIKFVLCTESTG